MLLNAGTRMADGQDGINFSVVFAPANKMHEDVGRYTV